MTRPYLYLVPRRRTYAAIAIFTYGHSAAEAYRTETVELARCHLKDVADPKNFCFDMRGSDAAFTGLFSALVWPFYWSWELQQ